jgi:hypothetical protein
MAQTGYTPIQLYYSSTATNAPLAANLAGGELAINITDGKLFYKDNANAVQVIGWKVVPATAGGTGQTSYAVGDLLYANTTTTLAKLADVATGNALISGGVSTAPSWGKIGLTTHVSGTLPIANGGTAQTSFTDGQIHFGSFSTSSNLYWDNTNYRLSIGKGTSPSYKIDVLQATATATRLATSTATASTCTHYFEIANDFSGISQAFVQGVGPGNSGFSQLAFGVSITNVSTTATDVARFDTGGNFRPSADNAYSCGTGALRWSVIYSATALINTSDGTLKTIIGSIDDAEKRVAQRIKSGIKKFKFNDSIAEKGDGARIHWGVIAQDVKAAFEAEGLNAEQYAMFCADTWFEKDGQKVLNEFGEIMTSGDCPDGATKITRLGVRYEELLTFIIASM